CAIDGDKMMLESGFSEDEWEKYLRKMKVKLHAYREKRIRPGLDNKQLTSWNALFVKGLVDAYRVFGKQQYLDLAIKTANFIRRDCFSDETSLLHQPADHNRKIFGFLDDYAFTIDSFISLYEATFDEDWLYEAEGLTQEAIGMFYDEEEKTFFYTADDAEELIARKSEIMDNVIPASSSAIVRVLYRLGEIFDQERYIAIADQVFANVFPQIKQYGSAYSNWAIQLL